jgi:hypothetical protein
MNEIVIFPSRRKTALAFLGSIGFVALGGFLIASASGFEDMFQLLIGGVAILFFGSIGFYIGYRLIRPSPALRINEEGIYDNASLSSVGLIRWQEISDLVVYELMGQKTLGIIPFDWPALLSKQSRYKQMLLKANADLAAAPINIPQAILPMPVEELQEKILSYHAVLSDRAKS